MVLKPAHEIIVEKIVTHCNNLIWMEADIAKGGVLTSGILYPAAELSKDTTLEMGGMCALLDVLKIMNIPEDKLPEVINTLKTITYRHCVIDTTIESLLARSQGKQD